MRDDLSPATQADLAAVDALFARSYARQLAADYPPSIMVTDVPLIVRARPELLRSGRYLLALDMGDGALVAAEGWPPNGPRRGQMRHVLTDARHLRRGAGRRLVTAVLSQAREAGIRAMDCLSTRNAVPFCAALGFDRLGPVSIALRPGIVFPVERMSREL